MLTTHNVIEFIAKVSIVASNDHVNEKIDQGNIK